MKVNLEISVEELIELMHQQKAKRVFFVWDRELKEVISSHSFLKNIATALKDDHVDYHAHEGIFLEIGSNSNALMGAFIHNTVRGQAAGGVRFWPYTKFMDYLKDGVRLAKGMTHKNALAGLWWGGGKGVICRPNNYRDPEVRKTIFKEYGEFISTLRGSYVTAEDLGANTDDMYNVLRGTRFTTCIPPKTGGSGNPSIPTAEGVLSGMEAALRFKGMDNLEGKSIAVMGAGNVGGHLIRLLFKKGVSRIISTDVDSERCESLKKEFQSEKLLVRMVPMDDMSILSEKVDILSPCATGGILNRSTIPTIQAPIVCGAANNQLKDPVQDGAAIRHRNIAYVPDFLVNRMGIVNCANEQYGYVPHDPFIQRHFDPEWENSIYRLTLQILQNAEHTGEASDAEAIRLAEEYSSVPHPIWGHRGQQIIRGLLHDHWESYVSF
jgi:glutamate dehydrogenase/leucine dehydrogenase